MRENALLLREVLKKPSKHQVFFLVCAEQCDLRLKIRFCLKFLTVQFECEEVSSLSSWQLIVQVCVSMHHMGTLSRLGSPGRPLLIALPLSRTCSKMKMLSACQMRSVFLIFFFFCFGTHWSLSRCVCWVSPEIKPYSAVCSPDPTEGWKLLLTAVIFRPFTFKKKKCKLWLSPPNPLRIRSNIREKDGIYSSVCSGTWNRFWFVMHLHS